MSSLAQIFQGVVFVPKLSKGNRPCQAVVRAWECEDVACLYSIIPRNDNGLIGILHKKSHFRCLFLVMMLTAVDLC